MGRGAGCERWGRRQGETSAAACRAPCAALPLRTTCNWPINRFSRLCTNSVAYHTTLTQTEMRASLPATHHAKSAVVPSSNVTRPSSNRVPIARPRHGGCMQPAARYSGCGQRHAARRPCLAARSAAIDSQEQESSPLVMGTLSEVDDADSQAFAVAMAQVCTAAAPSRPHTPLAAARAQTAFGLRRCLHGVRCHDDAPRHPPAPSCPHPCPARRHPGGRRHKGPGRDGPARGAPGVVVFLHGAQLGHQ